MTEILYELLKLLEVAGKMRQANRQRYFEKWIEPAHEHAARIYRDYRTLLAELKVRIRRGDRPEPIIRFLEKRRQELQPARAQIRAQVSERLKEGRVTRFEAGIFGLLTGVATGVDRPYIQAQGYDPRDGSLRPVPGNHTVLDILEKFTRHGHRSIAPIRKELLAAVTEKERGLELAWHNIALGYAEAHGETLPRFFLAPRPRRRTDEGLALIKMYLQEIHQMVTSRSYSRELPKNLQKVVHECFPSLAAAAADLREVVHDLDDHEPNVTVDNLQESLEGFETMLDRLVAPKAICF